MMMEPSSPRAAAGAAVRRRRLSTDAAQERLPRSRADRRLRCCRTRWREGVGGAFQMGVTHGLYCLGCCWALMLLLFAGGVMNLAVILALTVWVAIEKLAPFGRQSARVGGALLLAAGVWMLAR